MGDWGRPCPASCGYTRLNASRLTFLCVCSLLSKVREGGAGQHRADHKRFAARDTLNAFSVLRWRPLRVRSCSSGPSVQRSTQRRSLCALRASARPNPLARSLSVSCDEWTIVRETSRGRRAARFARSKAAGLRAPRREFSWAFVRLRVPPVYFYCPLPPAGESPQAKSAAPKTPHHF